VVTATGRAPRVVGNGDEVGRLMLVIGHGERRKRCVRVDPRSGLGTLAGGAEEHGSSPAQLAQREPIEMAAWLGSVRVGGSGSGLSRH
jgi:hypothetical protein